MSPPRHCLLLQHEPWGGPGLLAGWLRKRGFETSMVMVPEVEELPDPSDFDLVVSLGSEACAAGDEAWIGREVDLVRRAHDEGVPVYGICFGGQILARALGGQVLPDQVAEIGWREIETLDRDLVSMGPWFEWHFDLIEMPPGAQLIARSAQGVEAFQVGSSVGVQFHPEVDPDMIALWIEDSDGSLEKAGVEPESLFDGMGEGPLEERAFELFDAISKRIGATPGGPA